MERNRLSCTNIILPEGKQGILRPDSEGYYIINAGGFNIPNRSGIVYPVNDYIRTCMQDKDSEFGRRLYMKQMYGEMGHPEPFYKERLPNGEIVVTKIKQLFEWVQRLKKIDVDNYCMFIDNVFWDYDKNDTNLTGPVLNSIRCKPMGAKGQEFKDMIEDPNVNAAVSIRTVIKPAGPMDRVRYVEYFVTYDVVFEPGMLRACKYLTEGLEHFSDVSDVSANDNEYYLDFTTDSKTMLDVIRTGIDDLNKNKVVGAEDLEGLESMFNVIHANMKKRDIRIRKSILDLF